MKSLQMMLNKTLVLYIKFIFGPFIVTKTISNVETRVIHLRAYHGMTPPFPSPPLLQTIVGSFILRRCNRRLKLSHQNLEKFTALVFSFITKFFPQLLPVSIHLIFNTSNRFNYTARKLQRFSSFHSYRSNFRSMSLTMDMWKELKNIKTYTKAKQIWTLIKTTDQIQKFVVRSISEKPDSIGNKLRFERFATKRRENSLSLER